MNKKDDEVIILSDELAIHDGRKQVQDAINRGIVTPEELRQAGVVKLVPDCQCGHGLAILGKNLVCPVCKRKGVQEDE